MPNRLIREGFLDSEAIHSLSDAAECFFHRLMLTADDAGRMDGRVEILRARLFPLDLSRRASDVEKTLSECVSQGLVIPYERKSQRFLQLTKWQRCSPCVTSKYPWRDGSFRIDYVKVETRDGSKDFVATSLETIPSARDTDGIEVVIPPMYGDVDGDGYVNEQEQGASPAAPPPAKSQTKSGARLPDDWTLPAEWAAWARSKRPDLDVAEQGEKFADHWRAIPGAKGRKTDWQGTWRNWIRNERKGQNPPPPSAVQSGKPQGPSETPLERAVSYARQQFHYGQIDEAERDRLIAAATEKHRGAK